MPKSPATELARRESDDRLVDRSIQEIDRIIRASAINAVVAVGDHLIATFFGGDLDLARSKNPLKPAALNRLFDRADELPISAYALKRAVRLAIQYRDLPSATRDALSVRHQALLLPVPDTAEKAKLAEMAVAKNFTTRQLERVVQQKRPKPRAGKPAGRPVLPTLVKHTSALRRIVEKQDVGMTITPAALRALDDETLHLIQRDLTALREHLERIGDAVTRRTRF